MKATQAHQIRSYGALPIDFETATVDQYVTTHTAGEGFDVIYDTVGGATLDASFVAVRRYGGHVVSCLGWGTHSLAPLSFRAATYSGVFSLIPMLTGRGRGNHGHILRGAKVLIEEGKIVPMLDARRFDLSSATAAHREVQGGRTAGKVVIEIRQA